MWMIADMYGILNKEKFDIFHGAEKVNAILKFFVAGVSRDSEFHLSQSASCYYRYDEMMMTSGNLLRAFFRRFCFSFTRSRVCRISPQVEYSFHFISLSFARWIAPNLTPIWVLLSSADTRSSNLETDLSARI